MADPAALSESWPGHQKSIAPDQELRLHSVS